MFNAKAHKKYLIKWLQDFIKTTGAKGITLGISGGIDSAVIAHLAKEASVPAIGIWMDIGSSVGAMRNALRVFDDSEIGRKSINLTSAWENIVETLDDSYTYESKTEYETRLLKSVEEGFMEDTQPWSKNYKETEAYKLSIANIKARLRMTAVYQVAQQNGMLVAGTSNKTEVYLGYFTKWGDGAADFYPIANLVKSEVYALAKELGVNERIINAAPSADLWEGQTDENHIGVSYDEIEEYLKGKEIRQEAVEIIERMHVAAQHKYTNKLTMPEEVK